MKKRSLAALAGILLMIFLVGRILWNGAHRTTRIVLPERISASDASGYLEDEHAVLQTVDITPETVQSAISTLSRPESYRRTMTLERFWSGGSTSETVSVCVSGGWTRTDTPAANHSTRHVLTDGETTHIWYNDETVCYTGSAGWISADDEQSIPTYEDLLSLTTEQITVADYRQLSGLNCIYVETVLSTRYWIDVDTGLLAAAEQLSSNHDEVAWRITGLSLSDEPPTTADFTLPDGTVLLEIGGD